jgi:histidinol dehydrogenase
MQILDWNSLSVRGRRDALTRLQFQSRSEVLRAVQEVIDAVRRDGDKALIHYTERFDAVRLESLAVTPAEFSAARGELTVAQLTALERAIANVERFHAAQIALPISVETEPGIRCEEVIRPLSRAGLYVPAGTAPLPSTAIMLAVPARIAGVRERVLCTPPGRDGRASAAVLAAAQLCGIETVFKVGGAQAIAALAYGTENIPKVDKVFGPGNGFVTAAKQLVSLDPEGAACDLPAGPSEVMVIADETARAEFVAADLLAQAEHGAYAQAILVTDRRALAEGVALEMSRQVGSLKRVATLSRSIASIRCVLVRSLSAAVSVANQYAPEHLILQVREPRRWLREIHNAGSVFLGSWSPETLGDYCSGTNHVLPTYGYARAASGLSLSDFVKTISVQEVAPDGLRALGPTAITLAQLEGLDAHANAVARRLTALEALDGCTVELPAGVYP